MFERNIFQAKMLVMYAYFILILLFCTSSGSVGSASDLYSVGP